MKTLLQKLHLYIVRWRYIIFPTLILILTVESVLILRTRSSQEVTPSLTASGDVALVSNAALGCASTTSLVLQWDVPAKPTGTVHGRITDATKGIDTNFTVPLASGYYVLTGVVQSDSYYGSVWVVNGTAHISTPRISAESCLDTSNRVALAPLQTAVTASKTITTTQMQVSEDLLSQIQKSAPPVGRPRYTAAAPSPTEGSVTITATSLVNVQAGSSPGLIMAWIYPGDPACNAPNEYSDGRKIDVLKPEYYTVQNDGTLLELTTANSGCNAYSAANAASIKQYSTQQFFTVSANPPGIQALVSNSTLSSTAINTLVAFTKQIGFTGVELDFEGYDEWSTQDYSNYKSFVTSLGNALHTNGEKLMLDGPPISDGEEQSYYLWKYEDFETMPVDYMVVMAYDYQYSYGAGTPVEPLSWLTNISLWMRSKISDSSRIVIGIPSYGYHGTDGSYNITIDTYAQSQTDPGFSTATRDSSSSEMTFKHGKTDYFYQDQIAMDTKEATVFATGLSNISVWHLGGNLWFSK